jgi:hypothetical protein
LDKYHKETLKTQIGQTYAQMSTITSEKEMAFSNLSSKAKINNAEMLDSIDLHGMNRKEQTDAIATAIYKGLLVLGEDGKSFKLGGADQKQTEKELRSLGLNPKTVDNVKAFDSSVYSAVGELREYGKALELLTQESNSYEKALIAQAQLLMDTSEM